MQEMQEMGAQSLGQKDPLEKEVETCSSILAWEITRTEEPDRLQSTGLPARSWTQLSMHEDKEKKALF